MLHSYEMTLEDFLHRPSKGNLICPMSEWFAMIDEKKTIIDIEIKRRYPELKYFYPYELPRASASGIQNPAEHRMCVEYALREKLPVPENVLEAYPDLQEYVRFGIKPFRISPATGSYERLELLRFLGEAFDFVQHQKQVIQECNNSIDIQKNILIGQGKDRVIIDGISYEATNPIISNCMLKRSIAGTRINDIQEKLRRSKDLLAQCIQDDIFEQRTLKPYRDYERVRKLQKELLKKLGVKKELLGIK